MLIHWHFALLMRCHCRDCCRRSIGDFLNHDSLTLCHLVSLGEVIGLEFLMKCLHRQTDFSRWTSSKSPCGWPIWPSFNCAVDRLSVVLLRDFQITLFCPAPLMSLLSYGWNGSGGLTVWVFARGLTWRLFGFSRLNNKVVVDAFRKT